MKYIRSTSGLIFTFLLLFIVGISTGFWLRLRETSRYVKTDQLTFMEAFLSLLGLLIFCVVSARVVLWAYSKCRLPHHPILIFSLGLLVSIGSVIFRIWLSLQQLHYFYAILGEQVTSNFSVLGNIDYFAVGFETAFLSCGTITIALLWFSRWKERHNDTAHSNNTKVQNIVLITATCVVFTMIVITFARHMYFAAFLNRLKQDRFPTFQSLIVKNENF